MSQPSKSYERPTTVTKDFLPTSGGMKKKEYETDPGRKSSKVPFKRQRPAHIPDNVQRTVIGRE